MKCSRCQHENPTGQKFCGECGARLVSSCPSCRATNPPGQKFCGQCGASLTDALPTKKFVSPESYTPKHLAEKILTSKSALEGERKQVTVLFADLKGSMELLADRDPEEARKILDPVLDRMMEAVHRYEGTVNQVMGDGIMALFGAPLAHEDHAVRACYAALRMQESVKKYAEEVRRSHAVVVKIRVGLNSGEVVVRVIGSDLHMDYTAVGQTTHLAARMEQLADPGAIVITPETLALTEGYVEVKSLGPVPVKGLPDPVEVYEITGAGPARTRLQAVARRGLTRFVGRDTELEHLRRAQQLAGGGNGQIAAIIGEAGVGKSRLVYEFTHSHRLQGWLVLEAAPVSYGKATSYLPVIDLLKGYFKIQDRDDLREIREKVTGKLVTLDEALRPTLPALLALVDVPVDDATWQKLDPPQRRQRTLDAVKRLLLRETREQPVLLVVEDLHWIDGETQALLESLVDSLGSVHLLLLVNYRPEYQHVWGSKTCYSQLRLDALPAESAGQLLDALLGDEPGLTPLKQLLVKRGNPFFLEETVRTLVETKALAGERGRYRLTQPIQVIQVPPTVQAMLAARIDRLVSEDKSLLQTASVVGKDVPLSLLQVIAELPDEALRRGLDRLQVAELVYETGLFPDLEYAFTHALTHEVTYGSLLQERRRQLHARIVGAIETLHRDRLGEYIEPLANHSRRGELWDKAAFYLREAGRRAFARSANGDASQYFEQALEALARLPVSRDNLEQTFDLRIELRTAQQALRDFDGQAVNLAEALRIAEGLDDERRAGTALMYASLRAVLVEDSEEALRVGQRAYRVGHALGDVGLQVGTGCFLGIIYEGLANYREAVEMFEASIALIPPEAIHNRFGQAWIPSTLARGIQARVLCHLGRFGEALQRAHDALRIAEAADNGYSVASTVHCIGFVKLFKGDHAGSVAYLERSVAVWESLHVTPWRFVFATLGLAYCRTGRVAEGLSILESRANQGGSDWAYPIAAALTEGYLAAGRLDDAWHHAWRALELAREKRHGGNEAYALQLLGDVAARSGRSGVAKWYLDGLAMAEPRGMRPLIAHCHLGLGKLYRRTGNPEQARRHLTTATTMYREMDMPFWVEQAEAR